MKKILFLFIFVHYLCVLGNERTEIILKERVVVLGPVITLGEIAEIKCDDAEIKEFLSAVKIANSPRPLKIRKIRDVYVANRLKLNKFARDVKISGSEEVVISTDSREIKEDEIINCVKDYLEDKLPYKPENHEIQIRKKIGSIFAPSWNLHLKVIERKIAMMKGSFQINVGIYTGEALFKSIMVPLKVRTFENVVIIKERIARGDVIKRESLSLEKKETTTYGNDVIYSIEDVAGKRAKATIIAGGIIKEKAIEDMPVVERGERIHIIVQKGSVTIRSPGKALQDGYMGEFIRVLVLSSNENIMAEVNGKSSVLIK